MSTLQNIYQVTDEDIISLLYSPEGKLYTAKCAEKCLKKLGIYEYLQNRYNDSDSLSETLYRIKNKIEIRPVCKTCGGHVKFYKEFMTYCNRFCAQRNEKVQEKRENTFIKNYGVKCSLQAESVQEKTKETLLSKYGVENPSQSTICKEKAKQTSFERYGTEYPMSSDIIKERRNKNNLEKYGVKCTLELEEVKAKTNKTVKEKYGVEYIAQNNDIKHKFVETCKKTNLEKYGVEYTLQLKEVKEKIRKTNLERYGVKYVSQNPEIYKRVIETKLKNNTINASTPEVKCFNYLNLVFNNIKTQYKTKEYPYFCDFYIPSLNLYIEYQGFWTHGLHPYNKYDENDINKMNYWKSKNSKFYNIAIKTWTIYDVKKSELAKQNQLNYLEVFPGFDLEQLSDFIINNFDNISNKQIVIGTNEKMYI